MKRREQPPEYAPPPRPVRMQSAGLYGEVGMLPVSRTGPVQLHEPKTPL